MRWLAILALAGCTEVRKCKSSTVFVDVTLDAASATADSLEATFVTDSSSLSGQLAHTPGKASGGLELTLPTYTTGLSGSLHITAKLAGEIVGEGQSPLTLAKTCTRVMVAVSATVPPDLSVASDLSSESDLSVVEVDQAAPIDLLVPLDLASCGNNKLCVESTPNGWTGPIELAEGSGSPLPALACDNPDYSTDAYSGNRAPQSTGSQCSCVCGSPTGVSCQGFMSILPSACNAACSLGFAIGTNCAAVDITGWDTSQCNTSSWVGSASGSTIGSCGAPTCSPPPTVWTEVAHGCSPATAPDSTGCRSNEICARAPAAGRKLCLTHPGDVPCLLGSAYSVRQLYYGAMSDARTCSPKTCTKLGGSCTWTAGFYGANNCGTEQATIKNTDGVSCKALPALPKSIKFDTLTVATTPSCSPQPSAVGGSLDNDATTATTVCCLP